MKNSKIPPTGDPPQGDKIQISNVLRRGGFTLLETVVSIGIIGLVVVTTLTVFNYALGILAENRLRTGAITLVEQQLELVRNLPFNSIGTVGGIPSGRLPQNQVMPLNDVSYTITTQVIFVDDPFDGTVGGVPNDPLGNDYKKVRIAASWVGRYGVKSYVAITTVAPKGVETALSGGTLAITVFDANGQPVPQADVTVTNAAVTPPINTTIQTDATGRYFFPGAPASLNSYAVSAGKIGYSTSATCAIDLAGNACTAAEGNPTPTQPHASVLEGQLTEISFAIDRLSTMVVRTIRQGTASSWNINTGGGTYDQDNPAMALCPNGNYLFVWRDYRQNNNPRIYAQQYTPAKTAVWSPDLAITTSNNQNAPDVAPDGNCNIYYVWQDDRNGNQDIYFKKYSSAGVDAWGGEKKVDVASQSADQTNPQVVVNASSTAEYLIWQDASADPGDLYAQKFDPDGNRVWSNEIKINTDAGGATQAAPKIALDPDENLAVIWHDNRTGNNDIYGQKISRDGVHLWAQDIRINSDAATVEQRNAAFALATTTDRYIVWEDERNGNPDIHAQKYDGNGARLWSTDIRVNSDTGAAVQAVPAVAVAPDGSIVVVWEDSRNGAADVYLQRIDADGTKLIDFDVRINDPPDGNQSNPSVLINAAGKIVVSWQDNAAGNYDIKAAVFADDPQAVTAVPNVTFTLSGVKRMGENPVILKYTQNHATDGAGEITLPNLEWDNYTLQPTGHTLLWTEPAQPVLLNPNANITVILNLQ